MRHIIQIFIINCVMMATVAQASHMSDEAIDKRTSPVGQVHVEGMPKTIAEEPAVAAKVVATPVSTIAVAQETTSTRNGESLYNTFCIACHSTGLANAPKTGDSATWSKLMERGIDDLVSSAKKGKNVMPPMGTCADCSDDELKNAILFMSGS